MRTNNKTYMVKGRCMRGSSVSKYILQSSTGELIATNVSETIHLIGRGLVTNLRLTPNSNNMGVRIRGNGVNILKLPVYDEIEGKYREMNNNSNIGEFKAESVADYTITRRIMINDECIGFMLKNRMGIEKPSRTKKVMSLALNGKISNATLVKHKNEKTGNTTSILRGISCSLLELPLIVADSNGNAITEKGIKGVTVRVTMMREAGILRYSDGSKIQFNPSNILVFNEFGKIDVYSQAEFVSRFNIINANVALADSLSQQSSKYNIDLFKSQTVKLNSKTVKSWRVAEYK